MSAPGLAEVDGFQQGRQRWLIGWCAFCVLLGVLARLVHYLRCQSYWYDEGFLLINVFQRSALDLLGPLEENLVIPPAFLWLVRGVYELVGGAEWAMRLPALAAGLLAIACFIALARRALDGPAWIWAVCLAALSMRSLKHACEVRPYTVDLLATILILLATLRVGKRGGILSLLTLACIGPWLSFPSLLGLGAASLALGWQAWRQKDRRLWPVWLALNVATALSLLALWYFSARHLYYTGMIEHWGHQGWGGFPDWSRPLAILQWVLASPFRVAEYSYQSMGVPLMLLWGMGLCLLISRGRAALAWLLGAPVALGILAGLLGKYPLADRTTLYAAPCIWLGAAAGLEWLRQIAASRWPAWSYALPAALLVLAFTQMSRTLVKPPRPFEFREAYAYVHSQLQPGDAVCPGEVSLYRVYHGLDAPLCDHGALSGVARQQRVWLISSIPDHGQGDIARKLQQLHSLGGRTALRRQFSGVEVLLYLPPFSSLAPNPVPE